MLTALDPRGSMPFSLEEASAVPGFGPVLQLEALEPGYYEARCTGSAVVCFGSSASDGGVVVTPSTPVRILVEVSERLCAASMADGCTLTMHPVVIVDEAMVRRADAPSLLAKGRSRCGA